MSEAPTFPDLTRASPGIVEWQTASGSLAYQEAVATMEARVSDIRHGAAGELVWLVEHPPLYTAGTSAKPDDLLDVDRFPVHETGRGGQYTYHGPGQRVAYAMIDLRQRGQDLRAYVRGLEAWVIETLSVFGVTGERRDGRVGIWVAHPDGREDKIAAIGVRVRHWVTYHGISINVSPDLDHFSGIVPCGIGEEHLGVTSLADLGIAASMADVDAALKTSFTKVFG
ncbi:MAG: lipoyl(octanoyl) transferase LipB [Rhodospirillaceae bacterium]|jgi:lipoyl(octanoyl) transferase|nr:lipoyl(octanoyl) transferase LipB [Rhodospirillaceae bacterium]MBT4771892.1 lipoyl(octanoyl) transferase LipB [Rhodospirillaceae bacterium]MBT5358479.1 lipoyl(octanoyl) transferase LipB [Rhodospirillaceae bacterium]MBT5768832.1 lipoyl(octanoyl) transferase LipB [Rhodospirillaceae bacterium]MBT6310374.1 lipoyl(octanoyl) transferase LipB [Rhodospirillaceae bacterium]